MADLIFTVSQTTADSLTAWLQSRAGGVSPTVKVLPNGATFPRAADEAAPSTAQARFCESLRLGTTFLMVGTLEPRKGHAMVMEALSLIWQRTDEPINLVIVGRKGWCVDRLAQRILKHPEQGSRLHWLQDVDDAFLAELYSSSSCLIAASYGEGFGLPLVEAAAKGLPIIARDIPVFREVAREQALYFNTDDSAILAAVLEQWRSLSRRSGGQARAFHFETWEQTNATMLATIKSIARLTCSDLGRSHRSSQQNTPNIH